MPVILKPADDERWLSLDPRADDLLAPYPAEEMATWQVSPRVNGPAIDEPTLLDPVA